MAATNKELRDDVILRLTQGKPSQDFEISNAQIDRWIDISRDKYISKYIVETMKVGGIHSVDPIYIQEASSISISEASGIGHKASVSLDILDIAPNDAGVLRLRIYDEPAAATYKTIAKSNIFTNELIEDMEFSASTSEKPTYYRAGGYFYIKGLGSITVGEWKCGIEFVQGVTGGGLAAYSIADNHVDDIALMAEELGRRELGMPVIADEINDGSQNSQLNAKQ